jgi:hypothetical protein
VCLFIEGSGLSLLSLARPEGWACEFQGAYRNRSNMSSGPFSISRTSGHSKALLFIFRNKYFRAFEATVDYSAPLSEGSGNDDSTISIQNPRESFQK